MTLVVAIAALIALLVLFNFYEHGSGFCLACGGRGAHKRGCPLDKD